MKKVRYLVILLFVFSVFSFALVSAKNIDYDLWYKDHEWLMLKQEKEEWKLLTSDQAKKEFIEQFYEARDPHTFTAKNEFEESYQKNLEKVRTEHPDQDDPRRYVYLLFGEPNLRRAYSSQSIFIDFLNTKIQVGEGKIWQYQFGKQNYQVIFAKVSIYQLQLARDQQRKDDFFSTSFRSSKYEILYAGSRIHADIAAFIQNFFQEGYRLKATSDIVNDLKKSILDRAKEFYKKSQPKVKQERYLYHWKKGLQILLTQFDINSPEEVGIDVWFLFSKNSLYADNRNQHRADISIFCRIEDVNGEQVIYYRDDRIEYELKKKANYYYHFSGGLPTGKYKLIIEAGDNIGKKHLKIETDINIVDYSKPGLKANILVGKAVKDQERIKEKARYIYFKEGIFCPAMNGEYFQDDDQLIVVFDIFGFRKNHYGNSYLDVYLEFIKGKIEQGKFIPIGEAYRYRFPPIEKNGHQFQSSMKIKVRKLGKDLKLFPGLYKIKLTIRDAIAGHSGSIEYFSLIMILSSGVLEDINRNNLIRGKN